MITTSGAGSYHIGGKAAQTSYHARGQARRIGLPLNQSVTINFGLISIDPRKAVAAFGKLRRNHFNKWAARPRKGMGVAFPPTYAFAFENVRDNVAFRTMAEGEPHNVHVHWELHIPAARYHDFEMQLWGWIERTCGTIAAAEAVKIIPLADVQSRRNYLVKGTTKALAELYGRGQQAEPQGVIFGGRRADTSRNLGPTARRKLDRELGIFRHIPSRPRPANAAHV